MHLNFTIDFLSCINGCAEWNTNSEYTCFGVVWESGNYGPKGVEGGCQCFYMWGIPVAGESDNVTFSAVLVQDADQVAHSLSPLTKANIAGSSANSTSRATVTVTSTVSSSAGISGGTIGGIVGGILGALIILGLCVFLLMRRKPRQPPNYAINGGVPAIPAPEVAGGRLAEDSPSELP
jgi:hypothetical protein